MRFEFATATRIVFGEGTAATLPELARTFGTRPLVVTGASTERAASLVSALSAETFAVPGEPTVDLVREGARRVQNAACDVVISLGGGSAIDAGKAIATIATNGGEPLEFLEVVGKGRAIEVAAAAVSLRCRPRPEPAAKSRATQCSDRRSTASKRVCEVH